MDKVWLLWWGQNLCGVYGSGERATAAREARIEDELAHRRPLVERGRMAAEYLDRGTLEQAIHVQAREVL